MADYTRSTGSSGTMMIRDTGGVVEFWLKAGSSTFNHDLPWSYIANGAQSAWMQFDFVSGGNWQKLGSVNVTTSQTVTFRLGATGTSGLGGPTDFAVSIKRQSEPDPPSAVSFSAITSTSVFASFTDGDDNGRAIDQRQIGYSTSSAGPTAYATSDGSTTISGLKPGTTYYFWARTHNAEGWSGWSVRSSVRTYSVPSAPSGVNFSNIKQTSVDVSFADPYNGGTPIRERQIGYGLSSTSVDVTTGSDGSTTITGLGAGQKYYFWARVRNDIGWGPWSPVKSVLLVAGARVKVGTTYMRAVPWVKVGEVWHIAQPWGKATGVWKKTS